MADIDRAKGLATAFQAALHLRHFTDTRHIYGDVPNERTALDIHQALLTLLDGELRALNVPLIAWPEERPHFENTESTIGLSKLGAILFILLCRELNCEPEEHEKVKELARNSALPPVSRIEARIQEALVFDCQFPLERVGTVYASRERALWVVGRYWEFYRAMLLSHGSANVCLTPHPLLRFIVNTRARIEHYLPKVNDAKLTAAFSEAMEIPFDVDTLDTWTEWALPIVVRTSEAYEQARLNIAVGGLDLTEAERLFLASGEVSLKEFERVVGEESRKFLARVEQAYPIAERETSKKPDTCFEWVRRAECALRDLIVDEARMRRGDQWPREVEGLLGSAAESARERMVKEGVTDPEELVHFTQLPDVVAVVASSFNLYAPRLGMKKKQFNILVTPILAGRTKEAHHRPERFWSEMEQQRVKLACHDLLKALLAPQTSKDIQQLGG